MRRLRKSGGGPREGGGYRMLLATTLAAATVVAIDVRGGDESPIDPLRSAIGSTVGPVQTVADGAVRPFRDLGQAMRSNRSLRHDVAELQAQNSRLQGRLSTSAVDRHRLQEYDGLTQAARDTGYAMVPARVVGVGPAQSFRRTVTINAGTSSGVHADSTVVNHQGLVGRVVSATRTTATVLLVCDADSVVGGRLGSTMKIGFIRGRGTIGERGRLDLELVDNTATPSRHDVVVSWGSARGGPYVAGIPIGTVQRVYASPRELSKRAVLDPYVDFSALDLVGVVVAKDTESDRALVRPSGRIK